MERFLKEMEREYDAIIVDTSIFDQNGLRLEKGLIGKLSQFKKSPICFLLPDVIKNEIKSHLEKKIKASKLALEKALNDAGDHLSFEENELNEAKKLLIDSKEIEGLAENRLVNFVETTGATVLECGDHVSVSELLVNYFSNKPPFAETGKKKNEFPDAIVLLAVEAWAKIHDFSVLAIAKDKDWEEYCERSIRIDYMVDLSSGLAVFNTENAPYALLDNLEKALIDNTAQVFLSAIEAELKSIFEDFTPDQDADSYLFWEPEGCHGWFKDFYLANNEFRIIDKDENWVVLEATTVITVEAEGEFSLYVHDSIDRDNVPMGDITANAMAEFQSKILLTVSGDLDGPLDQLSVDEVEVINPIDSIDFGSIEPDYNEYD